MKVKNANNSLHTCAGMTSAHPLYAKKEKILREKDAEIDKSLTTSQSAYSQIKGRAMRAKADNMHKDTIRALMKPIKHSEGGEVTRNFSPEVDKWLSGPSQ